MATAVREQREKGNSSHSVDPRDDSDKSKPILLKLADRAEERIELSKDAGTQPEGWEEVPSV